MESFDKSITIPEHISSMAHNFDAFKDSFPKTYLAAEVINDIFDQFFTKLFIHDSNIQWQVSISTMLFGTLMSWVQAFYLTAAGQSDVGLGSVRKAIEYVCYICKMYGSDERSKLWEKKNETIEYSKEFAKIFSIPQGYFGKKYKKIIPLLVYYDFTSNFGVHGNLTSFATKWKEVKESGSIEMTFQDSSEWTPILTSSVLQIGDLIIDVFLEFLKNKLFEFENFDKNILIRKNMVRDSRIEIANYSYNGKVNYAIIKAIHDNDMRGINELFNVIKQNYNK